MNIKRLLIIGSLIVVAIVALLSYFSISKYPPEVMQDVDDRAVRTLYSLVLNNKKDTDLKIVEVTLNDQTKKRRAFVSFNDIDFQYLGELAPLRDDIPAEFAFLEFNDLALITVWVPDNYKADFVTFKRVASKLNDDSMSVLSTAELSNKVGLIYDDFNLWSDLAGLRMTKGTGTLYEQEFYPPLPLSYQTIREP